VPHCGHSAVGEPGASPSASVLDAVLAAGEAQAAISIPHVSQ
jgi:hypothetical protein